MSKDYLVIYVMWYVGLIIARHFLGFELAMFIGIASVMATIRT